jgi:Flp pilus assembly protein TadB
MMFSLQAINIEMSSGIQFGEALNHISERDYGEFSKEMGRISRESQKYGLKVALEKSAERTPSKTYKRVMWQLLNSLETGADMRANISSIVTDLKRAQENEAQKYARSLEKQLTVYIMGAIVMPALAVVILQTISSLGLTGQGVGEWTYWMILAFSAFVQVFFLYVIRFRKPSLIEGSFLTQPKAKNAKEWIKMLLNYAGIDTPWHVYLATRVILSLAAGFAIAYLLSPFANTNLLLLAAFASVFALVTFFTQLAYLADLRGVRAAEYLPDALQMMAANIQVGIATDQALLMSAKEDFGVLNEEIRKMGTDMMKNRSFEEALNGLRNRIKSESLQLSVNLVSHGLKAGRGLSSALFNIADILRDREYVRQQVASQLQAIKTTVIILVIFSAPLLYGTSVTASSIMMEFNGKLGKDLPDSIKSQTWFKLGGGSSVSLEFLNKYVMANLFVTCVFGALIIGEVTTGKAKEGLRYMFIMVLTTEVLYIVVRAVLTERIGGVFV